MMNISKLLKWFLPLLLLLLIAPWSAKIDPFISHIFYSSDLLSFSKEPYHKLIYHYGVIPALALAIGSAFLFVLSYFSKGLEKFRLPCFFLAASMALGAGFITHCLFKEFWFRPRPVQTLLFGGIETFKPFYAAKFNFPNFCKSFPSGHATMGFYFINLILLGKRLKNLKLIYVGQALTLVMSGLLCFTRIAQGAHFFTDVLMSFIVTWYAALAIEKLTFEYLAKKQWLKLHER